MSRKTLHTGHVRTKRAKGIARSTLLSPFKSSTRADTAQQLSWKKGSGDAKVTTERSHRGFVPFPCWLWTADSVSSIREGGDLPSVEHWFYLSQSQPVTGLPTTQQWETQITAANGLYSTRDVSNRPWPCSPLIRSYWFGGLIPLILLQQRTWTWRSSVWKGWEHHNWTEPSLREGLPHSHTQLIGHNPRPILSNRNSIGFHMFQSGGKSCHSYKPTFFY